MMRFRKQSGWFVCMSAVFVFCCTAFALNDANTGTPYLARLEFATEDLVPIVMFDVTESPYDADDRGRKDCTSAFAKALEDAAESGGTVFVPEGTYRIEGELSIPSGVTLRGDWKKPQSDDRSVGGTILLAYAGRGNADGKAFINLEKGGARDLTVFYPEQDADQIEPYPYTFALTPYSAIENITLVNSYRGVISEDFTSVMNLYATTLDVGVAMLKAAAVPRCRNIHLSPRYWSESGLDDAPAYTKLQKTLTEREAFGIQLNRQDAGIFIDVDIEGYHTGIKFMPPHGWTYWHNINIRDVEVGIQFAGGSNHRGYMTGSSIDADKYCILMEMDKRLWEPGWERLRKDPAKEYGTPKDDGLLRMFDCRLRSDESCIFLDGSFNQKINMQECTFEKWGREDEDAAIRGVNGSYVLYDCEFKDRERHIILTGQPDLLELVSNEFKGRHDIDVPKIRNEKTDYKVDRDIGPSMEAIRPVPDMLPARTDRNALYVATERPYEASSDGREDATDAIQKALDRAGKEGGGTVYLPQGRYRITQPLAVPPGVELRGVNDFMPRGTQVRTLLIADVPDDRGNPDNPPLITLGSSETLGGSGLAGVGIWYPHQDYRKIDPYPWTIRSLGPACWVNRVYLGNCYNAIDFATFNSDRHVLSRICGSALNIAFRVGHCETIGWTDNCHIRPQDWALANPKEKRNPRPGDGYVFEIPGDEYAKPTAEDVAREAEYSLIPNMRGAGAITIGSGANEQVTAFFCNGATRAFDFVDHDGTGGGSANILIGGSEAGWGAWFKELDRKGVTIVNFSFNPMTRLEYTASEDIPEGQLPKGLAIRIEEGVSDRTPINMIMPKFYGRKEIDHGVEMYGGELFLKQGLISKYGGDVIKEKGGSYLIRNTPLDSVFSDD